MNSDRSNARIDYEGSDEDHESYPIDNERSGQSKLPKINDCLVFEPQLLFYKTCPKYVLLFIIIGEGKDLELTLNTCSPNCKYCKAKGPRATSEWCLLECNNVGAARCLSSWCECY